MLDLQRNLSRPTITTGALPLAEHILAHEIAEEFPLLIHRSRDFGILYLLGVKTAHFDRDLAHWQQGGDEADRFDGRLGFGAQRGGEANQPCGDDWTSVRGGSVSCGSDDFVDTVVVESSYR